MASERGRQDVPTDAAGWIARLGSDQRTRADEEAFEAWVERDPANCRLFDEHAVLWNGIDAIGRDGAMRELLADAPGDHRLHRRQAMAAMAGGVALLGGVAGAPALLRRLSETDNKLETQAGRQRIIRLADNSVVTLDADAVVEAALGRTERRLSLVRGRAFFEVARDTSRPFRVFVDGMEVRALGTGFTVTRERAGASIVLEHGAVAIFNDPKRETMPDAILRPGERADVSHAAPIAIGQADLPRSQAWRFGRLVFDNVTLGAAVADVNRYGGPRILLADDRIAAIPISGVFHVGMPDAFVDTVTAAVPVLVARRDAATIVLTSS